MTEMIIEAPLAKLKELARLQAELKELDRKIAAKTSESAASD